LVPVKDALLLLADSGTIQVGLSFPIVFEFLQDCDPEHRADRIDRARFLKQLCGRSAFPFLSDMFEGSGFADDGIWMPRKPLANFTIRRLEEKLAEALRKRAPLNRAQRRKLARKESLRQLIATDTNVMRLSEADLGDFPVSEEFVQGDYLRRYLLGKASAHEVDRVLRSWISDPESFFSLWYKYLGRKNLLSEMLDAHVQKMVSAFVKLREAQHELDQARKNLLEARRRLREIQSTLPEELRRTCRLPKLKLTPSKPMLFDNHTCMQMIGAERAEIAAAYFNSRFLGANFSPSDLADIMHAMYLPMCDFWRGDRKFATMLRRASVPHSEKIVISLAELPDRINARLRSIAA
jgi:hypothetical protein